MAIRTVCDFQKEHPGKIDVVRFVLFDKRTLLMYEHAVEEIR